MLEHITWKTYLTAVAAGVCIYYAVFFLYFYSRKIRTKVNIGATNADAQEIFEGSFSELEKLTEEIRHSILEEAGTDTSKEELIVQFRHRLANYDGLRQPAFRGAITNYLIQESENICGIEFTSEELNQQWDTLIKQK